MSNGIFVAASGSAGQIQRLEALAQNLANARTTGFKSEDVTLREVRAERRDAGTRPADKDYAQTRESFVRPAQGPLTRTDDPLDIALSGNGYLRVRTARGDRLTRDGRLMLTRDGSLRTRAGDAVLDPAGRALHLPPDRVPTIGSDGVIRSGDLDVGRLDVVAVDTSTRLDKDEAGLFQVPEVPPSGPTRADYTVSQGYLEASNVSPVQMMTKLVEVQRHFEALHQVISTYREMDQTAVRLTR